MVSHGNYLSLFMLSNQYYPFRMLLFPQTLKEAIWTSSFQSKLINIHFQPEVPITVYLKSGEYPENVLHCFKDTFGCQVSDKKVKQCCKY